MRLAIMLALAASAYGQARWEHPIGAWQTLKAAPAVSSPAVELQSAPPAPVTARFIPVSLAAAAPQSGTGREAGVWHIEVCNLAASRSAIPLPLVLQAAPSVRWIPAEYYAALFTQRTKRSPWHILNDVLAGAGSITAVTGLAQGNSQIAAIGSGVTAALGILGSVVKGQISVAPVFLMPNACPATVDIQPGACVECNALASLMRGAATIGPNPVRLP